MRRSAPKEVYWLIATAVLFALSIYCIIKKPVRYGLDINGGIRAVLQAEPRPGQPYSQSAVVRILENRLNSSGVAEPSIQPKGAMQIIVELPNVRNKDAIIDQLKTTAQMEFRWFKDVGTVKQNSGDRYIIGTNYDTQGREVSSFTDQLTGKKFRDQAQVLEDFQSVLASDSQRPGAAIATVPAPLSQFAPDGITLYFSPSQVSQVASLNQELISFQQLLADSPLEMTGADVQPNAKAGLDTSGGVGAGGPVVDISFTEKGTTEFANFTQGHVGNLLAIILDGRVLSAPNINDPILNGSCTISGGFANLTEAQTLANFLNAGALPVNLSIVQVESVDATLGHSAVHDSIVAGAVGLAFVLIFMAGYYLLPGLVADLALLIYAVFTLAVFKGALAWLGVPAVTLTLPGIAGFILSVGMAVDANILIFERMKEELRHGKSLRAAIDNGFVRAFPAIRDSNICTLITCTILFSMGTASVKGFALTLGLGVVISLFTAITVTRSLLYLLVTAGAGKNPALFGLGRQTEPRFDAVKNRKVFYLISLLIIVPGIIAFLAGGLKQSIEFTGGTQVEAAFTSSVPRATILSALSRHGFHDSLVQMADRGKIAYVSVKSIDHNAYLAVQSALGTVGTPFDVASHSLVGPQISKELTWNAFQAVIIASILIVLYLATVFAIGGFVAGLRFGTSAIVALVHDVLVLIGLFSIFGFLLNWQIDSLFVTAVLTVVGFSVHDTIVIFDRLRENLRHRIAGESFEDLANRSIQQSFARSVNTSFTVVLTLVALLIFGEPSTKLLIWALLIGIISGTYSSIFNATPILVDWEMWLAKRIPTATVPRITSSASSESPVVNSRQDIKNVPTTLVTPNGGTTGATDLDLPSISRSRLKKRGAPRRY